MTAQTSPGDSRPPWDAGWAASLVGKYVLVGVIYLDPTGRPVEQRHLHGTIIEADERHGFAVRLQGREGR